MSTISTAIIKLEQLITENHVEPKVEEVVKKVISLLTDPTVLLLEWNELDVQKMAGEIIAHLGNVAREDIIDNPLPRKDVEWVISRLEHYYDCNYGITWDSIRNILDEVDLPKAEDCLIESCLWTREFGLEDSYETGCGNTYDYGTDNHERDLFTYCPYCGKKLKEADNVGDQEKE